MTFGFKFFTQKLLFRFLRLLLDTVVTFNGKIHLLRERHYLLRNLALLQDAFFLIRPVRCNAPIHECVIRQVS
uniref:Putative secreted peptide n=1 Tax=Anopheles braziliensis TaxID=58242 RepID=A0A2M3ZU77_9DIPT